VTHRNVREIDLHVLHFIAITGFWLGLAALLESGLPAAPYAVRDPRFASVAAVFCGAILVPFLRPYLHVAGVQRSWRTLRTLVLVLAALHGFGLWTGFEPPSLRKPPPPYEPLRGMAAYGAIALVATFWHARLERQKVRFF
jgi:hypothetical protein